MVTQEELNRIEIIGKMKVIWKEMHNSASPDKYRKLANIYNGLCEKLDLEAE